MRTRLSRSFPLLIQSAAKQLILSTPSNAAAQTHTTTSAETRSTTSNFGFAAVNSADRFARKGFNGSTALSAGVDFAYGAAKTFTLSPLPRSPSIPFLTRLAASGMNAGLLYGYNQFRTIGGTAAYAFELYRRYSHVCVSIVDGNFVAHNAFSTKRVPIAAVQGGSWHPHRSGGVTYTLLEARPDQDSPAWIRVLALPPSDAAGIFETLQRST